MPDAVGLVEVTKRFGSVVALGGISLEITRGQFVTLLGPSGCGKTTLLRIVAGLERVTSGDVYLDGRRVTGVPPQRRALGFAFQRYALFPHLTVLENVAFGLRVRGVRFDERRGRALEMLEMVGLAGLADRMPSQISGGQAQRVALARALAPEPTVLLLDEPLTALDLAVRTAMQEELRRLHRELGTTFVYVTHDQGEALTMSDRIVLMREGVVDQDSSPFELYRRPASLFAATFVGEANAWPARVVAASAEGASCTVRVRGSLEVRGRSGAAVGGGDDAVYVIRPQRIHASAVDDPVGPARDGECIVQAEVRDVLVRGARALLVTDVAGGPPIRVELDGPDAERFGPGSRLRLAWSSEDAVVFRASSGGDVATAEERETRA
jgi:ABC-type Fe3+/spermidine/putrescine transport system ATPase subunit